MLEDNPVLRERVLAASAISAILIGGALAMNSIITGGWQWGVAAASTHAVYEDDVNQQWSEPAPSVAQAQPVALASANVVHPLSPEAAAASARSLQGGAASVSLTTYAPSPPKADAQPATQPATVDEDAATARFNQIEADVQQAMAAQAPQPDQQSDRN